MTMCMMLNIMQVQSVQLALPTLGADLDIQTTNLQWLISSYSVAFGGLLLLFGRLADIYGHKKVFTGGMIWFVIWSIACGFAQNEVSIDFFRAMQGAALGAAIPSALGILGSSFPPGQRKTTAFALFSAGAPMGGSLGAVLGGVLTEYAAITWRAVFFVSTGIGALIGLAALFLVPPDRAKDKSLTVDWIGGALITSAWRTPYIPTLLAVSIILFVVFWFYERYLEFRTSHPPLMRTVIWFKGRFAIVQLIGALGWSCFASYMFFCSLAFQACLIAYFPLVANRQLTLIVALLASRVPAHILITIGCLGTGLAPLLFAVQNYDDTYWRWQFPAMILSVFGADFIFACGILYVSHVAGHGHQALAGSLFNMSTQIGTGIGLAINTIVQDKVTARATRKVGMVYDPNARNTPLEAIHEGLNAAFYTCSGFAFVATLISATCLYGIGKVGHREEKRARKAEDEGEKVEV
ncbi:major Facilitator Superfamily protein [Rhodotorula toruloides]|uniref:Major Facilitator Superfamily protein n=1 Tax=Rhodotorula toruloides TaxID=5286 RepID=A0A511KQH0_RHOTO|nr:major Facilitator Superfamily protein [Rhodotorula toruloides]